MYLGNDEVGTVTLSPEGWVALERILEQIEVLRQQAVVAWHEAPPHSEALQVGLHEYLGMTWNEYQQWASDVQSEERNEAQEEVAQLRNQVTFLKDKIADLHHQLVESRESDAGSGNGQS